MKPLLLGCLLMIPLSAKSACQAPGQAFLEEKIKESFVTAPAEKELRDIVLDHRNYNLREEVKSLNRRSKYADRIELKEISAETNKKFYQMIDNTGRNDDIADFPVQGAFGRVSSGSDSLDIELNNLSKEDLDVIPPKVLDKLSNKVKVSYKYPYDKYDYHLTYDGRELPMKKALLKLQSDFEDACDERKRENQDARDYMKGFRKEKYGISAGSSSGQ